MSWREQAACRTVEPDVFFPERGESVAAAKRVCAGCPVRDECLEFAEETLQKFGVWGGLSERQRRMRRKGREMFCEGCGAPISLTAQGRWCAACRAPAKAEYARKRRRERAALEARTA